MTRVCCVYESIITRPLPLLSSDYIIFTEAPGMIRRHNVCAERISANVSRTSCFITTQRARPQLRHGTLGCLQFGCNKLCTRNDPDVFLLQKNFSKLTVDFFFVKIVPKAKIYYQLSICVTYVFW